MYLNAQNILQVTTTGNITMNRPIASDIKFIMSSVINCKEILREKISVRNTLEDVRNVLNVAANIIKFCSYVNT